MDVPILAYHKVSNQFEWGINSVSIRSFENQMKYLSENNYKTISLAQYCNHNFKFKSKYHPVIITFDDADETVYKQAFPIMRNFGFTAIVFVISGYVGKMNSWDANLGGIASKHLSWKQIKQLANAGWEIGSHTVTHRDLSGLSLEEVQRELQLSKQVIEQNVERPVRFISYPFNRFDRRTILEAQRVGYQGGCTLSPGRPTNGISRQFLLPRYGVYSIDSLNWFKLKLSNSKLEQVKQRCISFASIGTILYNNYRK